MAQKGRELGAIALGAIGGALSRYSLAIAFSQALGTDFPWGTFFCNLSGCFGMGFLITLISERWSVSPEIRLMLSVGFLGSYTTFSAYQMDADTLLASGRWELTFLYWIGSAVLGILLLELGADLARRIASDRQQ
jgi:fluoride exporter